MSNYEDLSDLLASAPAKSSSMSSFTGFEDVTANPFADLQSNSPVSSTETPELQTQQPQHQGSIQSNIVNASSEAKKIHQDVNPGSNVTDISAPSQELIKPEQPQQHSTAARRSRSSTPPSLRQSLSSLALHDPLTSVENDPLANPLGVETRKEPVVPYVPPEVLAKPSSAPIPAPEIKKAQEGDPLKTKSEVKTALSYIPEQQRKPVQTAPVILTNLPEFVIDVSEPTKVESAISPYITYKVRTKTSCPGFKNESIVNRRYSDFLWLFNRLVTKYPGVIVPPVPEKQSIGRFQDDFVENRRLGLERFVNRIAHHPRLYNDDDFKLFLESDMLSADIGDKKEKGGIMRVFGDAVSNTFMKIPEVDEWFEHRRIQLDQLESQLKVLLKSIEVVSKNRKDLAAALLNFGESMMALASIELNKPLSGKLILLGSLHGRAKNLQEKLASTDTIHLESTTEEYIRIINSIKVAFNARAKAFHNVQNLEKELNKKKDNLEKLKTHQRSRMDKIMASEADINDCEQRLLAARSDFQGISQTVKQELDRFDTEKIIDFQKSIQSWASGICDGEAEFIKLWEDYHRHSQNAEPPRTDGGAAGTTEAASKAQVDTGSGVGA
ncbi:Vps5 C terminal like-domain-containing protein [Paraphysoderma sedebokerense]|nr:Vps5 C terminal like-domain-containing protein [Paraphysoderma sedebokerense]